jgi:hypothetical protein
MRVLILGMLMAGMPNALDGCDIGAFEWQPADTKGKAPKP